jgi:hypothetical protein
MSKIYTERKISLEEKQKLNLNFDGDKLNYIKKKIDHMILLYGEDAEVHEEISYDSGGKYLAVFVRVTESDVDYARRIELETSRQVRLDKAEYSEFIRLQEKFSIKK